jgi:hypothetical protein
MTVVTNRLHEKPVLRLKTGGGSSQPSPLDPAPAPRPPPPPRPIPAAEPIPISKKRQRKLDGAAMRRRLIAMYPQCFGFPKKPLRIGVHLDILAAHPEFNPRTLADAIRTYIARGGYAECLVAGAIRFDLEGKPAGVVTAEQVKGPKAVTTEGVKNGS